MTHDGAPDNTAYQPAMPYDALPGPSEVWFRGGGGSKGGGGQGGLCPRMVMCELGGKKIALRGGDGTEAHLPTPPPPPPWSPCREGGLGWHCPTCRDGGGGGGPTPIYMAQNDPHVALIILTTHMWGKIFS